MLGSLDQHHNPNLIGISGSVEGGVFALAGEEISIGRDHTNGLPINDRSVSRRHCTIRKLATEQFEIRDLGSRNGTAINGLPVTARVLADGDEIRLGDCYFRFRRMGSSAQQSQAHVRLDEAALDTQTLLLHQLEAGGSSSLALLIKIGMGMQMVRGTGEIAEHLLACIFEAIPAARGAVLLFDPGRDEPAFACSRHRDGTPQPAPVDSAIVAQARREGIAILSPPGDVLAAPIRSQDTILGVIYIEAKVPPAAFADEHLQLAAAIGGILGAPFENSRRLEWLESENRRLQEAVDIEHDMVGGGPRMREIFQFVGKAAPTDSTVLIRGESGTGKELVARAIHRNSSRAGQRFLAINCAALAETLIESELFGHEKGAFTGALVRKQGKLEMADRGTLFLDEVGELPLAFQTKLLRVLQEREFERVGGTQPIKVDVRILAATNRDLESAVASGDFRKDLYYRLNVVSLAMPALRDHREDIPMLARYFTAKHGKHVKRRLAGLSPEAIACLEAYDWPGNVRELENAIERAIVLGTTELIIPEDLPEAVLDAPAASEAIGGYHQTVKEEKKRAILAALGRTGGSFTEAAKLLGVHPNYLHRLVRNLDLKEAVQKVSGH
ncbi:MAG TPA: sigma 54-interacting transcriptional regulator [Bryobacteraceae bacterium]|nr:sigma 54-interacting transcriptional regulator [Bryobacteraceae bacterium]